MENQQIAIALQQIAQQLANADAQRAKEDVRRAEERAKSEEKLASLITAVEDVKVQNTEIRAQNIEIKKENIELKKIVIAQGKEIITLKSELEKVNNNLLLIRKDLLMIGDRVVEVFEGISDELRDNINQDLINLQCDGMASRIDNLKQSNQFIKTNNSDTRGVYKTTKQQRRNGLAKSIYDIYSKDALLAGLHKERINGIKFLNRFLDKSFGLRFQNGILNYFVPVTKNVLTYYHYDRDAGLK